MDVDSIVKKIEEAESKLCGKPVTAYDVFVVAALHGPGGEIIGTTEWSLERLLKEQLEVFNCPNCPNQGWYSDGYQVNGEWEQEQVQVQCEFCCTHPQSVFNYMAKVKVSNFDLKIKE